MEVEVVLANERVQMEGIGILEELVTSKEIVEENPERSL